MRLGSVVLVSLVSAAGLVAGVRGAHASVIWRGDFSTGDLSQWTGEEWVSPDRLAVVTSPTADGHPYALHVTVKPGDDPTQTVGGERSELFYQGDRPQEGDERYYHWETMWPNDYQSGNKWQIFTQWHQYVTGGSPPLAFLAWGEQIMLGDPTPVRYWTAPLVRGVWHDFVFHVIWSSDATKGTVELWYDGQHVLPPTHGQTLFPGDSVYLKQGLYRSASLGVQQEVYHDGMIVGTTLADVVPPPAPAGGSGGSAASSAISGSGLSASEQDNLQHFAAKAGCATASGTWVLVPLALAGLLVTRRRRGQS